MRAAQYFDWIDAIEVKDQNGGSLAALGISAQLVSSSPQRDLGWVLGASKPIYVETEVMERGQIVGRISIAGSSLDFSKAVGRDLTDALLWSLVAALIGGTIAIFAQRKILRPIVQLAEAMDHSQTSGMLAPINLKAEGEIGILVQSYNSMIDAIETRDRALRNHQNVLERKVEERTHDLRVAQTAAERANESKSRFLATMSHEIRTPMNGVLVMAELLARSKLPPTQQGYASIISRSGKALLNLLNDILDFSKIEAGHLEIETLPIELDELIDDVAMLFWQRARDKSVTMIPSIAPSVPACVMGDPTRLRQCLSNLVGNAVKFTDTGAITIDVEWHETGETPNSGELSIAVRDTGEGIAEDRFGAIFEAFVQADETTTRTHGGTGLGLSITRQLVEAMGGRITLESVLGEGSTFMIWLPVQVAEAASTQTSFGDLAVSVELEDSYLSECVCAQLSARGVNVVTDINKAVARIVSATTLPERSPGDTPCILYWRLGDEEPGRHFEEGRVDELCTGPSGRRALEETLRRIETGEYRGKAALEAISAQGAENLQIFPGAKILVADDNEANRIVIGNALELLETEAVLVEDGAKALAALAQEPFDLVLLDRQMPVMVGFAAAGAIRERAMTDRDGRQVRVILFSATQVEPAILEENGFDGCLSKPFEMSELAETLDAQLAEERKAGAREMVAMSQSRVGRSEDSEYLDGATLCTLRALEGKRPGTLAKIIDRFSSDLPGLLERIETAAQSDDPLELATTSHALKSMAGTVGARELARLCGEIEDAARRDAAHERQPELESLRGVAETSRTLLQAELKNAA